MEQMGRSSLEVRQESIKRASNARLEFIKRLYDRRPIAEQYLNVNCDLHVHFLSRNGIFCARCRARNVEKPKPISIGEKCGCDDAPVRHELTVLVGTRNVPKDCRPVTTSIRLQRLDSCYMGGVETFEPSSLFPMRETLVSVFNRKLCSIDDHAAVEESKFVNKVIKGGTEIITDFPNDNTDIDRNIQVSTDDEIKFAEMIRVCIPFPGTCVLLLLPEGVESCYKIENVFACPCGPGIRAA